MVIIVLSQVLNNNLVPDCVRSNLRGSKFSWKYFGIPYSGNFRRKKNVCEFCGFVAIRKSFLHEIWGHGILWCGTNEQSAPRKSYFSPICESFLPWKFPAIRYCTWTNKCESMLYPQFQCPETDRFLSGTAPKELVDYIWGTWLHSKFPIVQVPSSAWPWSQLSEAWVPPATSLEHLW